VLDGEGIGARSPHVAQGSSEILHRSVVVLLPKSPHGALQPEIADVEKLAARSIVAHGAHIAPASRSGHPGLKT